MVKQEKIMAEGTGQGPEGPSAQNSSPSSEGARGFRVKPPQEAVLQNASLPEGQRGTAAESFLQTHKLLEGKLTEAQKQGIVKLHKIGEGEQGKNDQEAAVYNYKFGHIRVKAEGLRELGFNEAQTRALMDWGYVGRLPDAYSTRPDLDPGVYTDPLINKVITQAHRIIAAGNADEGFIDRMSAYIEAGRLNIQNPVDETEALRALDELQQLSNYARYPESRPTVDPLLPEATREKIESETSANSFLRTRLLYEHYRGINVASLPAPLQQELQTRLNDLATEIHNFVDAAEQLGILEDVNGRALKIYDDVRAARRREKYGYDKQRHIDQARSGYREYFWNDSPQFRQLMGTFRGVADYVWDGLVTEIEKEANHIEAPALNVVAEERFDQLKRERREVRASQKKYETFMYYGQRNYELTAESPEELPQAVLDYVVHKIAELARDPESAHSHAQQLVPKALEMLETNRDFLVTEENLDVPVTHPDYLRARYIAESVTYSLVTELMLYKGNVEAANAYRAKFANEFIAHHDAVYLENPYVAYMLHKLTTHREGTYWMGQPFDSEKIEAGEIEKYRAMIEKEIKEMALSHTLFISDDIFKSRKEVVTDPVTGKAIHDQKGREVIHDKSYSFNDPIEELLLDRLGSVWATTQQRLIAQGVDQADIVAAKNRHDTRVNVFRNIKDKLDREDGLALTPQQQQQLVQQLQQHYGRPATTAELYDAIVQIRNESIRRRILQEMLANNNKTSDEFAQTTQQTIAELTDLANNGRRASPEYDQKMWKWVEDYNKYRADLNMTGSTNILADPKWYPSGWDIVRMRIDRPTKVLDRMLSAEELEAMFEPTSLVEKYDVSRTAIKKRREEIRFGFQLARSYQLSLLQDAMLGGMRSRLIDINTGQYTGRLMDDEASRLLGLIDQQGNVVDPNRKLVRVFDIVQARLEAAIKEEAAEIEQAKRDKAAAVASGNQAAIKQASDKLRDMLVNAQFLATHALKAKGIIEGRLPAWPYNMLDDEALPVFMNALADYGVETAEGIPLSHEDKGLFYEIVERGRRALKSEWDRAVAEHMTTNYKVIAVEIDPLTGKTKIDPNTGKPVLKKDPQTGEYVQATSLWRAADDMTGEKGKKISSRYRMVNKGGNDQNRKVVDPRLEASTSGGIAVVELIPEQLDIGLYTLLIWEGVMDIRELHGYIHRRDEVEYQRHKYFHTMDPLNYVDSLAAAYPALNGFSGGKVGDQSTPGFGQEPFHGAWKASDWLIKHREKARVYEMYETAKYLQLMQVFRYQDRSYSDFLDTWSNDLIFVDKDGGEVAIKGSRYDLEKFRQMSYEDFEKLDKETQNDFYTTMYGIFDYFQNYLKGLKPVQTSRRKRAPRNWEEDNYKKFYDFRRKMRAAMQGKRKENGEWDTKPEAGFVMRLGYSPEIGSEIALRMLEVVLMDADYLDLRSYEINRRIKDGEDLLLPALDAKDIQDGFELKDNSGQTTRTWVIPDPKDWDKVIKSEVRKALEKIRRRGLLDFMMEEGYKIGNKRVLGQKVPPLVQREQAKKNPTVIMNAFDPGNTLRFAA